MNKIFGVGIPTRGIYSLSDGSGNGKHSYGYDVWFKMLERCYSEKFHQRSPTYAGCSIDVRFQDYQDFMQWATAQVGYGLSSFELDKDLLIKGNKIYSPDICVFIPKHLNSLLLRSSSIRGEYPIGVSMHLKSGKFAARCSVGRDGNRERKWLGLHRTPEEAFAAYKAYKEAYIKTLADEYAPIIDARVYVALKNYEVNIDD